LAADVVASSTADGMQRIPGRALLHLPHKPPPSLF
jgi:hypothetical protein